ncbi:MAG: HAD family hydrolase [Candidatus Micrarchaeia archaeon]|jgi:phosphoglycolate phosphatase-like HAD superfamily hydrolase
MPARTEIPVLVLIDADNTLFDSRDIYEKVLRKVFATHFPRRDFSELRLDNGNYSGKNLPQILKDIAWNQFKIPSNSFETRKESIIKQGIAEFTQALEKGDQVRVLKGVPELLGELKKRNAIIGVVTGNPEATARLALKNAKLDHHFSFILGGHEGNHKIENAFIALNQTLKEKLPKNVVIIGDSPTEANVAEKIGFGFIGTATGLHTIEQLKKHSPDMPVFADLSNTPEVLKAIFEKERPQVRIAPNAVVRTRRAR